MSTLRIFLLSFALVFYAVVGIATEKLDINNATANALAQTLKGIGPAKAQAIVKYRQEHGLFKSVDQLVLVKGISQQGLDKIRHQLVAISSQE